MKQGQYSRVEHRGVSAPRHLQNGHKNRGHYSLYWQRNDPLDMSFLARKIGIYRKRIDVENESHLSVFHHHLCQSVGMDSRRSFEFQKNRLGRIHHLQPRIRSRSKHECGNESLRGAEIAETRIQTWLTILTLDFIYRRGRGFLGGLRCGMIHFGSIRNPVRFSNSEAMRFNFIPNLPRFFIARFVAHTGQGVTPKHQGNFAGTGAFNHG